MIWNGKRYAGVRVYIGKQDGDAPGEYIVVYHCNVGGRYLDAAVGLMAGDKFPSMSASVSHDYLYENFRPLSYRKIPEADRAKLERWVTD